MAQALKALVATALCVAAARATERSVLEYTDLKVDVTATSGFDPHVDTLRNKPAPWTESPPPLGCPPSARSPRLPSSTRLLIGVKSAVLDGFGSRQTIRETWGDSVADGADVAVVFLGCEPDWAALDDFNKSRREVEDEKEAYGDLLTHELQCRDSYHTLVDKVKGFFRWAHDHEAANAVPALEFVMLVDDDVYVDVRVLKRVLFDAAVPLVSPKRFYGGQVIQKQFDIALHPLRDPHERNYLPIDLYPLSEKPLFATGAHYLLSVDLVSFLARNSADLRGVGTLEDVSVGFWLSTLLGIYPVHIPWFDNVRFTLCRNALAAYADLSQTAMRRIHENFRFNQSLCDGFSASEWDKRDRTLKTRLSLSQLTGGTRILRTLSHKWDLQFDKHSSVFQIRTSISARDSQANETAVAIYTPAKDTFEAFCRYFLGVAQVEMPTTVVPRAFCLEHRVLLTQFMASAAAADPAYKQVYALTHSNLKQDAESLAVFVQLTKSVAKERTLVECLMAAAFEDLHVVLLDTEDHEKRFGTITPDLVVTTDADENQADHSDGVRAVMPRALVFRHPEDFDDETPNACRMEEAPGKVEISSFTERPPCHGRHVYIPIASQSFARRFTHSPMALLEPASSTQSLRSESIFFACHAERAVAVAAGEVLRTLLRRADVPVVAPDCRVEALSETLDEEVMRFSRYKFVVVIEDRLATPGHVSDRLVSAFLADAVPVYVGHSATATRIFNARAFIDCGLGYSTLHDCAARVRRVAKDPRAYDAMRTTAPIVNRRVFLELFSWHPDVIDAADHIHEGSRQQQLDSPPSLLGDRLRALILSA